MRQGFSMLALAVALAAFCGRPTSVHAQFFPEPPEAGIPQPIFGVIAHSPAPRNLLDPSPGAAFPAAPAGILIAQDCVASGD